ncbi:MAG: peptidylprolyl isomerase [Gammaproteobacteria bacterium]|nr:peptidylprolyl isomerase [Gammaproteobacteria bacterium]
MQTSSGFTGTGFVEIELFDTVAPETVANFLNYVNAGDYDGTFIHRSVPGFILQMGGFIFDPAQGDFFAEGTSHIPTDPPVVNEFRMSNVRGTIAMAKLGGDPDSATSEFFFNLADNSENLDNQNGGFTVFAQVISGQDVIDAIVEEQRCSDYFIFNSGQCNGIIAFDDAPLLAMIATPTGGFLNPVAPQNLVKIISIGIDTDGDSVIDRVEDAGPNGGDGNNDGIADSEQSHVASLPDIRNSYITVEANPLQVLRALGFDEGTDYLAQADPLSSLNGLNFVYGFLSFDVLNVGAGGNAVIKIIVPNGESPKKYFKFGPTPDNPVDHLYEFDFDGETGAEFDGNEVTLHFVDGKRGDSDLLENGVITDPGTPALRAKNSGSGGGGSSGCSLRSEGAHAGQAGAWLLLCLIVLYAGWRKYQKHQ